MSRAEFIACSLAFHAVLLVIAVLLPAPFPSVPYTATDLSYVELTETTPTGNAEAGGTGPSAADNGTYYNPSLVERIAPPLPGRLRLAPGLAKLESRLDISKAASAANTAMPTGSDTKAGAQEASKQASGTPGQSAPATGTPPGAAAITALNVPDSKTRAVTTDRSSLNFRYQKGWPVPPMAGVDVDAPGSSWRAEPDSDWIVVSPASGKGPGRLNVGVMAASLDEGYHGGIVRLRSDAPGVPVCELPVSVMVLPEDPGIPELPHTAWDDYMDGNCKVCHLPGKLMPSKDFMERPEFCGLCHNPNGMASGCVPGPGGHPVMVNVTSGGARMPTGGTVASGAYSDRMSTHLLGGRVVCVTCHNVMYKPGDKGRTWELASTDDGKTYRLAKGGWAGMGYLVPKVYVTGRLMQLPDRLSGLGTFLAGAAAYDYDESDGTVTFKKPLDSSRYVYVTLSNPYLRRPTANNALCYDCHYENTHAGLNCLVCHTAHGTGNIMAVRESVRTQSGKERRVVFRNTTGPGSFADGRGAADGICEVCHTGPGASGGLMVHKDGRDYSGADCTSCHPHSAGFSAGGKIRTRRQ